MRHDDTTEPHRASASETRLTPLADVGLRMTAVVFLIAGVVIGFSHAIAVVIVAIGVLLLILNESLKHWPRKPVH